MNRRKFFAIAPAAVLAPVAAHSAAGEEGARASVLRLAESAPALAPNAAKYALGELIEDVEHGRITLLEIPDGLLIA
jgi:hypothetical protein